MNAAHTDKWDTRITRHTQDTFFDKSLFFSPQIVKRKHNSSMGNLSLYNSLWGKHHIYWQVTFVLFPGKYTLKHESNYIFVSKLAAVGKHTDCTAHCLGKHTGNWANHFQNKKYMAKVARRLKSINNPRALQNGTDEWVCAVCSLSVNTLYKRKLFWNTQSHYQTKKLKGSRDLWEWWQDFQSLAGPKLYDSPRSIITWTPPLLPERKVTINYSL